MLRLRLGVRGRFGGTHAGRTCTGQVRQPSQLLLQYRSAGLFANGLPTGLGSRGCGGVQFLAPGALAAACSRRAASWIRRSALVSSRARSTSAWDSSTVRTCSARRSRSAATVSCVCSRSRGTYEPGPARRSDRPAPGAAGPGRRAGWSAARSDAGREFLQLRRDRNPARYRPVGGTATRAKRYSPRFGPESDCFSLNNTPPDCSATANSRSPTMTMTAGRPSAFRR